MHPKCECRTSRTTYAAPRSAAGIGPPHGTSLLGPRIQARCDLYYGEKFVKLISGSFLSNLRLSFSV